MLIGTKIPLQSVPGEEDPALTVHRSKTIKERRKSRLAGIYVDLNENIAMTVPLTIPPQINELK